jgi:hypothetical protein
MDDVHQEQATRENKTQKTMPGIHRRFHVGHVIPLPHLRRRFCLRRMAWASFKLTRVMVLLFGHAFGWYSRAAIFLSFPARIRHFVGARYDLRNRNRAHYRQILHSDAT